MDSRDQLPLIHNKPSSQKTEPSRKRKESSRIKPKETLKVPSRRLESRIEKRKVARLIGGPVVRHMRPGDHAPQDTARIGSK